jgi:hypothetical protein
MSSFTDKLSITQISNKPRRWRLDRELVYHVGEKDSGTWIKVLPGFVCDGGSIPRIVWWLDSPIGDGAAAYFLHDAAYGAEIGTRAFCDFVMLEGLQVLGMGWTRRNIIYSSVRSCGGIVWGRHTAQSVLENRKYVETSFALPPLPNQLPGFFQ